MSTSVTPNANITYPDVGTEDATWGAILIAIYAKLDDMLRGYLPLSVAGSSDVTLTEAQWNHDVMKFTGVLTGNINVEFPDKQGNWRAWNATTGDFTLTAKTVGGTGVILPQNEKSRLVSDGTNIVEFDPQFAPPTSELTISSGSVTATGARHTVDTESDAATDNLDNVVATSLPDGFLLLLYAENASRTVTVRDSQTGAGEVHLKSDTAAVLSTDHPLLIQVVSGDWYEISRPDPTELQTAISVAVICDQRTQGTSGGGFTAGSDVVRVLDTEISDPDSIVSISSNQFTLGAGTYWIRWAAPAYDVNRHQSLLYDVTGAADVARGSSRYNETNNAINDYATGSAVISPASSNAYEIRHRCQTTEGNDGLGIAANFGAEIYTIVEIMKLA